MTPGARRLVGRLIFKFDEFFREIEGMRGMAEKFLAPESLGVMDALKGTLRSIQESGGDGRWEIPRNWPLRTKASKGYELSGKGKDRVLAEITGIWEVSALSEEKRRKTPARFGLVGNASVEVVLISGDSKERTELTRWQMEIGGQDSPGCFFHVHVDLDRDEPPFPKWLPVPRFPGLFTTPTVALEFTLGELFQEAWQRRVSEDNNYTKQWHPIQKERLLRVLKWQQGALEQGSGSPWITFKTIRPKEDIFVD